MEPAHAAIAAAAAWLLLAAVVLIPQAGGWIRRSLAALVLKKPPAAAAPPTAAGADEPAARFMQKMGHAADLYRLAGTPPEISTVREFITAAAAALEAANNGQPH